MTRRTRITTALAATLLGLTPAAALAQVPGAPTTPPPPPPPPPITLPAPPPPPQPVAPLTPPVLAGEVVDPAVMAAEVVKTMTANAFGWQFAIAKNGKLVTAVAGGSARSDADTPGIGANVAMTPAIRYELASLTKNFTAVATMKLLRAHGLTINARVGPWLPKTWLRSAGFRTVRFRHLLSHTSGINQMLAALPAGTAPSDNGWNAMRFIVRQPVVPGSPRRYKNANFAILRIANAFMWRRLGGRLNGVAVPVRRANHAAYALDYLRRHVFAPAGIKNVACRTSDTANAGLSYRAGSTQNTAGRLLSTSGEECAGARGTRLNAVEIVRYLVHLRHGAIIDPADLATMDALRLGWNEDSDGGDGDQNGIKDGKPDNPLSPGVFWHGGDLISDATPDPEVHTCGMTFPDGIEASIIVNSPLSSGGQCGVLLQAWAAART